VGAKRGAALTAALLLGAVQSAIGHQNYDPGVTDTEIEVGQNMPYSGPASAYGTIGRAEAAYFRMINEHGGVNGRRIKLISLDDGYNPARTVEVVRDLVEQEQVLLLFNPFGSAPNTAIQKYLNARKVPQLFLSSGASRFADPAHYPWTMGWLPIYQTEGRILANYILSVRPGARIGVLYQNDDLGRDYLKGLREGLGERAAAMIVAEASYEVSDPTIDSQVVTLQGAGADTLVQFTTPKFAAQVIRKAYDLDWHPLHITSQGGNSVSATLQPAGLEKSIGLISAAFLKDPTDPQWASDPDMRAWLAWMKRYYPEGNTADSYNVVGYTLAQLLVHVLERCGEDLTRDNVMHRAASIHDLQLPMLLPGIRIDTSSTDYLLIEQMQMQRFDGKSWVRFGPLLSR
jgi:branched-chain amino acid transport system substrate-binding protein